MKRFVDLRGQKTGYKFCWFDTVRDEFEFFSGSQCFDSWIEFEEGYEGSELERYKGLCPEWVFEL
jgi:hypothetical protein